MNNLQKIIKFLPQSLNRNPLVLSTINGYQNLRCNSNEPVDPPDESVLIARYKKRENEPLKQRKARLLYQSRKRGMLENDLLLSTFAAKYLDKFTNEETEQYDSLINGPSNDWDIYYWAVGIKPTPEEFDNNIMNLLKEHCKNLNRESRIRQPDLC